MVVSAGNPQGSPVQDGFRLVSSSPHYQISVLPVARPVRHRSAIMWPRMRVWLSLPLFPPMVQGKEPESVPFLGRGGDVLIPIHEKHFGSQLCPEKPVLAPSDSWGPDNCHSHAGYKTLSSKSHICSVCHHRPCSLSSLPTVAPSLSLVLEISLSCFWIQPGILNSLIFKAFLCVKTGVKDYPCQLSVPFWLKDRS